MSYDLDPEPTTPAEEFAARRRRCQHRTEFDVSLNDGDQCSHCGLPPHCHGY